MSVFLNSSFFLVIIGLLVYIIRTMINSVYEVKSATKQDNINEKREVYKHVVKSFRHLFEGRTEDPEEFLKAYDSALLWGSDSVIKKLTCFLECMHEREKDVDDYQEGLLEYQEDMIKYKDDAVKSNDAAQNKLMKILAETIIEMRKDLDFNKTKLTSNDIVFKVFNIRN